MVGWDPVVLAGVIGAKVPNIQVGTAVTLTYPRHPQALASAALSVQAATGNRFVLGVGPGHRPAIEARFGISDDKPAAHVRDYMGKLATMLDDTTGLPGVTRPKLLLSALGPVMLGIADDLADGTLLVWTSVQGVAELVAPRLHDKEIALTALVGVTDDPDALRAELAAQFQVDKLPNYQRHLARQGLSSIAETAILGDEKAVAQELRRFAAVGVTELVASVVGDRERTLDALR
jgi:alkanesulfonate monooxygenase SsuD/methylene tetrahydromethanopterin reductase-like flavin-dependent oxidoreductase (luciferase family)